MAKKRKRIKHKVNTNDKLRKTPLWKIHQMLADLPPHKQKALIGIIIEVQHPDAKQLAIEFL